MELRIVPTADMVIKLKDKTIGKLEALVLDASSGGGLLGIPKVKIAISIDASSFDDSKLCTALVEKVSKFKFLDITVRNVKKG